MVVNKKTLGACVRTTAVNSFKLSRKLQLEQLKKQIGEKTEEKTEVSS